MRVTTVLTRLPAGHFTPSLYLHRGRLVVSPSTQLLSHAPVSIDVVVTDVNPVLFPITYRHLQLLKGPNPPLLTSRNLGSILSSCIVSRTFATEVPNTPTSLTLLVSILLIVYVIVLSLTTGWSSLWVPLATPPELPSSGRRKLPGSTMVVVNIGLVNGFSLVLLYLVLIPLGRRQSKRRALPCTL